MFQKSVFVFFSILRIINYFRIYSDFPGGVFHHVQSLGGRIRPRSFLKIKRDCTIVILLPN